MKNIKEKLLSYGRSSVVVFLLFLSQTTKAAVVDITAEYKPSLSATELLEFENITPVSGQCANFPQDCPEGAFSVNVSNLTAKKRLIGSSNDAHFYLRAKSDSSVKRVVLTNESTGAKLNANFRLNMINLRIRTVAGGHNRVPTFLWGVIGGCSAGTGRGSGTTTYLVAWSTPEGINDCYKRFVAQNNDHIDSEYLISEIGLGYELKVDSPLGITNGTYVGEVEYSVGDGKDIDYYAYEYSDDEVRFRITATVEHAFHMQFPAGSNRIQLEPSGGWGQWLNSGRMPAKMERNVDFSLTTSGPMSIALRCEQEMGTNCALRNQNTGESVELETRVTLPGLKPLGGGAEVKDYRLATGPIKQFFIPDAYSYKRQSTVHFRVNQPHVETMLKQPGSQWAGNVTLMFEAGL